MKKIIFWLKNSYFLEYNACKSSFSRSHACIKIPRRGWHLSNMEASSFSDHTPFLWHVMIKGQKKQVSNKRSCLFIVFGVFALSACTFLCNKRQNLFFIPSCSFFKASWASSSPSSDYFCLWFGGASSFFFVCHLFFLFAKLSLLRKG